MVLFYIFIGGYMTLITGIGYVAARSMNGEYINDSVTNALHNL